MTKLLQQAFEAIAKLPADEQAAIAARLQAELKDEEARFEATTDDR